MVTNSASAISCACTCSELKRYTLPHKSEMNPNTKATERASLFLRVTSEVAVVLQMGLTAVMVLCGRRDVAVVDGGPRPSSVK
jgi:hypothetical protein